MPGNSETGNQPREWSSLEMIRCFHPYFCKLPKIGIYEVFFAGGGAISNALST
jgi:hypothetical protein